jgi:hypothetical protein
MIIYFDVTPAELECDNWIQVELAVSELCSAFRRGDHIVVMRRDTVEQALARGWPLAIQSTLSKLALDYAQSASLLSEASCVLNVRVSHQIARAKQYNHVIVDVQTFLQERLYMPGVLLVENATRDGALFKLILETAARRLGIGTIYAESAHGGAKT